MSSTGKVLSLKAPETLPAEGVSTISFKVWKNQATAWVEQETTHFLFLEGGIYSSWQARSDGLRITALHEDDPEKKRIEDKRAAAVLVAGRREPTDPIPPNEVTANEETRMKNELLQLRNAKLSKFIQHLANMCHYTEQDDITMLCTSVDWIWNYLARHYNIESRGVHFLKIAGVTFKAGTAYQTFFKQFRASFLDNLRKKDDKVLAKGGQKLKEDEIISPTFENAIVLWALERIDPRLPAKVRKDYGHLMVDDTTLADIQPTIFQNIASMLEDLETTEARHISAQEQDQIPPHLRAFSARGGPRGRGGFTPRGRGMRGRGSYSGETRVGKKFCRICKLAGKGALTFESHRIGSCSYLTDRDWEDLKATLNAVELGASDARDDVLEPFLEPGWEDPEDEDESGQL